MSGQSKFWLMVGEEYYPYPGVGDFENAYDNFEDAVAEAEYILSHDNWRILWCQIVEIRDNMPLGRWYHDYNSEDWEYDDTSPDPSRWQMS